MGEIGKEFELTNDEEGLLKDVLGRDNISDGIGEEVPLKVLERYFRAEQFGLLTGHSDPSLQGLIKQLGKSEDEGFLVECLKGALKCLRACYKAGDYESSVSSLNIVIKALSRMKRLEGELCEQIVGVVGLFSSNVLEKSVTSQVVLALAKCIELNVEACRSAFPETVESLLIEDTEQSLTTAFSLLSLIFHLNSELGQLVFAMDILQNNKINPNRFVMEKVAVAALEALSAACVDKECRKVVGTNFESVIASALTSDKQSIKLLATSILIKVKASSETNTKGEETEIIVDLSELLEQTVCDYEARHENYYGVALEGLAYTSLIQIIKERIVARKSLVKALHNVIKDDIRESPWVYCSLCVLANVTEYPPALNAEQEKLRDLKKYAGKANTMEQQTEDATLVNMRCKLILDSGVTGVISNNCPRFTMASKAVAGVLLRNLVTERQHRTTFTQQGGLAVLIYLLMQGNLPDAKSTAIVTSGLAKTLISVDPTIALSNKISPIVTIQPLVEQLSVQDASALPLLDIFEALLALTNLAAVDDTCRDKIVRDGFTKLELLMTHSNDYIQRAAVELVCNLSMSPYCAEKFLDGSGPAKSRLEILALLTDVDDKATRHAAAGALAVLSEWTPAANALLQVPRVLEKLFSILSDPTGDPEMTIRVVVCVKNIAIGGEAAQLKEKGAIDVLKNVAQKNRDSEVLSTCLEAIKAMSQA
jgi:hypothetical protein